MSDQEQESASSSLATVLKMSGRDIHDYDDNEFPDLFTSAAMSARTGAESLRNNPTANVADSLKENPTVNVADSQEPSASNENINIHVNAARNTKNEQRPSASGENIDLRINPDRSTRNEQRASASGENIDIRINPARNTRNEQRPSVTHRAYSREIAISLESKLQDMDLNQQKLAREAIQEILEQGSMGLLTPKSVPTVNKDNYSGCAVERHVLLGSDNDLFDD